MVGIENENLLYVLPFHDCSFSGDRLCYTLNSHSENVSRNDLDVSKKRGMHFIHININSSWPKIDEVCYIANITNASIVRIPKTKLDKTGLSSELEVDGFDLVRLDRTMRSSGVACCIKSLIAYSYKDRFCSNIESIFVEFYLSKPKPILYRLHNEPDFIKYVNNVFTETEILDK